MSLPKGNLMLNYIDFETKEIIIKIFPEMSYYVFIWFYICFSCTFGAYAPNWKWKEKGKLTFWFVISPYFYGDLPVQWKTLVSEIATHLSRNITVKLGVWWLYHIHIHYVKSVQIRRFFWSVFSCIRKSPYSFRIQENKVKKKHRIWALFKQW